MLFHRSLILTGIALAALSVAACDDRSKTETTERRVTADGTKIETTTTRDVSVDDEGRRSGTVERETTVDPEGILNKETVEESYEEVQE